MMSEGDPRQRLRQNLSRSKIPGLDGIRGFSALSVVAFHAVSWHFPGDHAVRMFFVLSGLLITWLLLKEHQKWGRFDLKAFYLRRGFRLLPPLAVLLVWEAISQQPPVGGRAIAATAFYYGNYYAATGGHMAALGHTWSLAIEEHFYLIWPAILSLLLFRKRLVAGVLAAAGASAAVQFFLAVSGFRLYAGNASEANAAAILTGCALALAIWRRPEAIPRFLFARGLGLVAFVAVCMLAQLSKPQMVAWGFTASIPFLVAIILQAIAYEWRILENPVARYLGRISYSVYLWQFVAIRFGEVAVEKLGYPLGQTVSRAAAGLIMSVAVAAGSHHFIESPAQNWIRKRLKRRTPQCVA